MEVSAWHRRYFDEEKPCWVVLHTPGRNPAGMWCAGVQMGQQPVVKWCLPNAEPSNCCSFDMPTHTINPPPLKPNTFQHAILITLANISIQPLALYSKYQDSSENMTGSACVEWAKPFSRRRRGVNDMPTYGRRDCIPNPRRRFRTVSWR